MVKAVVAAMVDRQRARENFILHERKSARARLVLEIVCVCESRLNMCV